MTIFKAKKISAWCLLLLSAPSFAEGMIDIKPYISTSVNYDDNVFRFSSPEQAKASLGSSNRSDYIKALNLGVDVNLRLSRQLVNLTANINKNKYSRFSNLDNTGKAIGLTWDWRLGSDVYGVLSASKTEAIAGFNETRSAVKNIRVIDKQSASINWNVVPNWTLYLNGERNNISNQASGSIQLDREDQIIESGIRYQSQLGTQLGLSYRMIDANYPGRTGLIKTFFGSQSSEKELALNAAWLPTSKTRISTRLSHVSLNRQDSQLANFNGFNQQWGIDYAATNKVNVNLVAYQVLSPIDDVVSTYVKTTGIAINPSWNITSKVALRGNLRYAENAYIGSAAISNSNIERLDASTQAGISLIYSPTLKSLLELQYSGEKRTSNIIDAGYQFNQFNVLFRYGF